MHNFFDPNEHKEILIPMYGRLHLLTLLFLPVLVTLMVSFKKTIKKWANNRHLMTGFVLSYLGFEFFYWLLVWIFRYEPIYERFPFHLCASLSLLLPILLISEKFKWIQFFTPWAVAAGIISFINPGYIHDTPWYFAFIHYLIRHYTVFALPIFLYIGKGYSLTYRLFLKSTSALVGYSFLIFLFNWISGANYLHLGQHNPLMIPFLPESYTRWPWVYPSFVAVGIVLIHLVYLGFSIAEKQRAKKMAYIIE